MGFADDKNAKVKLAIAGGVLVVGVALISYNLMKGNPPPGEIVPAETPPPPPEPGAQPVNPTAVPPRPSFNPPIVK